MTALLNKIIRAGGTTAMETPIGEEELAFWFIDGPAVFTASAAVSANGALTGFQSVVNNTELPLGWGDIATYVRIGATQRGIGRALIAHTLEAAKAATLTTLNATIRDDNTGGLCYYRKVGFQQ